MTNELAGSLPGYAWKPGQPALTVGTTPSRSPEMQNELGELDTSSGIVRSVIYPFYDYTGQNFSSSMTEPVYAAKPGQPVFASA